MNRIFIIIVFLFPASANAQLKSFYHSDSIRVTIDYGKKYSKGKETTIVFYALPNGNTTEQTIGKKLREGDDWHFDIQHIGAQSDFIRERLRDINFIVVYLENSLRSWPAWKRRYADFNVKIPSLVDSIVNMIQGKRKQVYLNGHSGGGSFIFGYLSGVTKIPASVRRISFIDSNYGYDSSYYPKIKEWLAKGKGRALNVFAYNDSVVIYNGKPLVSPTGGTWYRSRMMRNDISKDFPLEMERNDSVISYASRDRRIQFYFRQNPEAKIFHTQQVELNGFIHSILCGTRWESGGYKYFGVRAY